MTKHSLCLLCSRLTITVICCANHECDNIDIENVDRGGEENILRGFVKPQAAQEYVHVLIMLARGAFSNNKLYNLGHLFIHPTPSLE